MSHIYFISLVLLLGCGTPAPKGANEPGGQTETDPLKNISKEELFDQGIALARAGDMIRSEQYLAAAYDKGYNPEQVLPVLLAVCVQSSRLSAALNYATPELDHHPHNWSLRTVVASIHMGLENFERAEAEFVQALRDAPETNRAPIHFQLASLYHDKLNQDEKAKPHYEAYLSLAPEGEHKDEARFALDNIQSTNAPPENTGLPTAIH